jgi:hypothetical protein
VDTRGVEAQETLDEIAERFTFDRTNAAGLAITRAVTMHRRETTRRSRL